MTRETAIRHLLQWMTLLDVCSVCLSRFFQHFPFWLKAQQSISRIQAGRPIQWSIVFDSVNNELFLIVSVFFCISDIRRKTGIHNLEAGVEETMPLFGFFFQKRLQWLAEGTRYAKSALRLPDSQSTDLGEKESWMTQGWNRKKYAAVVRPALLHVIAWGYLFKLCCWIVSNTPILLRCAAVHS